MATPPAKRPRGRPPKVRAPGEAPAARASKRPAPPKKEKIRDKLRLPTHITRVDLAKLTGFTPRWLAILEEQDVISRDSEGRYKLLDVMPRIVEYVRETEKKKVVDTSGESLRKTREREIARRMAKDDRVIITLEEASEVVDFLVGRFVEAIDTLPAKVTKDAKERARLETAIDVVRNDIADDLVKASGSLAKGVSPHEITGEDDA